MSQLEPCLTTDEIDYLLSLSDSGLEDWLASLDPAEEAETLELLRERSKPPVTVKPLSLYEFLQEAWPTIRPAEAFIPGWHIEAYCRHLEHATETPGYNLVATIPPGCSKSIVTAVAWPAWVWGPRAWCSAKFLFASYSEGLATRDSMACRDLIQSEWYGENWPEVEICDDENKKMEFRLTGGGYRLATGTSGRGTGEHPHFVVGDDVSKASHTAVEFQAAVDWWSRTMSTRGRILGSRRIMDGQRLRLGDVPGWCISAGYDHFNLPMWSPKWAFDAVTGKPIMPKPTAIGWTDGRLPGELLWPEALPEKAARDMEAELGPIDAAAQLQQAPVRIAAGGLFPRGKAQYIAQEDVPLGQVDKWVRYWDKAGGESAGSDRSAGMRMGRWTRRDGSVKYLFWHLVVGRWNPFERDEIIESTAKQDRRENAAVELWIEREMGGAGRQSAEISARDLVQYGVRFEQPNTNKVIRAKPLSSAWHADNCLIVVGPWNALFLDEMEAFSGEDQPGMHDDVVDASSGAANQLFLAPKSSGGLPMGIRARF